MNLPNAFVTACKRTECTKIAPKFFKVNAALLFGFSIQNLRAILGHTVAYSLKVREIVLIALNVKEEETVTH